MKCEICGEKAVVGCIENKKCYCVNCSVLVNVNNMGETLSDYHFKSLNHHCDFKMLDVEWGDYKMLYGGGVYDCDEYDDGRLFVHNGEYGNRVNYCPFCGFKAEKQMKCKK